MLDGETNDLAQRLAHEILLCLSDAADCRRAVVVDGSFAVRINSCNIKQQPMGN